MSIQKQAGNFVGVPGASEQNAVKINIDKDRYDQNTYWGRVRHFLNIVDMRTLFTTDSKLQESLDLLRMYKDGTLNRQVTDDELWEAKKLKDAIVHPDLGEKIPLPFRMSFQVPGNVLIVAGMLQASTIPSTVFFQFVNQTFNVAVNHSNRNASNIMTTEDIAQAYAGAVAASVGTAIGLNHYVKNSSSFSPALRATLTRFVPFAAVAVANIFNVGLMRRVEMSDGILIKDSEDRVIGRSAIAGKLAVAQTAATRVISSIPVMVIPPLIFAKFEAKPWLQKTWQRTAFNCGLIGGSLFTFLPLCIALFPQIGSISADKLEPIFQSIPDSNGKPISTFYYNKGL